jgi:hypothetical protein
MIASRARSAAEKGQGNGFSAEAKLVLLLGRGTISPEIGDAAGSLIAAGPSWSEVVRIARQHGVLPLLMRSLQRLPCPGPPPILRSEFEAELRLNAVRNELLRRSLRTLLQRVAEEAIPVIPLKGVGLADSLYGDVGLRVCSDVDILVPRRAVGHAFQVLLASGYEHADRQQIDTSEVDFLLRSSMEYGFVSPRSGFPYLLELHWDIAWRWRADAAMMDDLWADAHRRVFWGVEALTLSPEWELLYLAVHAARHRWQGLKWLVDIHELCIRGGFDWKRLAEKAENFGLETALSLSLGASQTLLHTPLPATYAGRRIPSWVRPFPALAAPASVWQDALSARRLFRRRQDRLRYLARLLLLPTLGERELIRLPAALEILYYLFRPIRLGLVWGAFIARSGVERLHPVTWRHRVRVSSDRELTTGAQSGRGP